MNKYPPKKIVVIGGGTGNFTVLRGLKKYPVSLTAVVSMADDGGSTGILRDELGVLPPGDVRQCLIALASSSRLLRLLMDYRFEHGNLDGHSFGNLLLSALEKVTGSFEKAVEEAGKILSIKGTVLPVTIRQVRLKMLLQSKEILEGEKTIYLSEKIDQGYQKIYLDPHPEVNPIVVDAITEADLIVIGPGGWHTSVIPNVLVDGVVEALSRSKAKKLFIVNLMNRKGQTTGYKVSDYLGELTRFTAKDFFDYLLVNSGRPPKDLINRYAEEGELVENDMRQDPRVIGADLLGKLAEVKKNDFLQKRSLIRHDPQKLASEIMQVVVHL